MFMRNTHKHDNFKITLYLANDSLNVAVIILSRVKIFPKKRNYLGELNHKSGDSPASLTVPSCNNYSRTALVFNAHDDSGQCN